MIKFKRWLLLVAAISLPACSTTYKLPKPPNIYTATNPYPKSPISAELQTPHNSIIYATDRLPEMSETGELKFQSERSRQVSFGTADVIIGENKSWVELVAAARSDIPRVKLKAEVSSLKPVGQFPETPMGFTVNNGKVIIEPQTAAAKTKAQEVLRALIQDKMKTAQSREVILYIHGYKTSFEEAVLTVNDIHHYTGRHGVPVAYSWPSDGGNILFGYFRDQSSAEFTVYHLKEFLRTVMEMPDVSKIHVIAHSLGTDVATTALRELLIETRAAGLNPRDKFKIENLILAAPDLDYGVVTQRLISEQLGPAFGRITVYTNKKDRALSVSNMIHSGIRFGKLLPGQGKPQEDAVFNNIKNVDFITVQGGKEGFFNHGYFSKDPATLSDIVTLITNPGGPGTEDRPLDKLDGNFWEMDSDYLKTNDLEAAETG